MKLILNEGKTTEVEYEIDSVFERILDNILTCSKNVDGETPEITPPATRDLESVKIMDGDTEIPLVCTYNHLNDFVINITEHNYNYSITINKVV